MAGSEQALLDAFGEETCDIDVVVVVIGWEDGILTGSNGVMVRIASAAATQVGEDTVAFPAAAIVRVGAVQRPLSAAHPRQEQARKNDVNSHFGDGLHIPAAMQSKGGRMDSKSR